MDKDCEGRSEATITGQSVKLPSELRSFVASLMDYGVAELQTSEEEVGQLQTYSRQYTLTYHGNVVRVKEYEGNNFHGVVAEGDQNTAAALVLYHALELGEPTVLKLNELTESGAVSNSSGVVRISSRWFSPGTVSEVAEILNQRPTYEHIVEIDTNRLIDLTWALKSDVDSITTMRMYERLEAQGDYRTGDARLPAAARRKMYGPDWRKRESEFGHEL